MSVQKLIDEALAKEQAARANRERSGKFNPSMFGACYRKQYYNRKNIQQSNPPDERTLRVFKVGKLFHNFAQSFYPEAQTEVKIEIEDVLGYADVVIDEAVIDIKSQHSRAFWWMEKTNYNINIEKKHNILQVVFYAWMLKKKEGRLVFVSKDDLCVAEYGFFAENWFPEVEEELKNLRQWWSSGTIPPQEPRLFGVGKDKKPKECGLYCSWRDYCYGELQ